MTSKRNKEVVQLFWDAMSGGDIAMLDSFLAQDFRYFAAGDLPACASWSRADYVPAMTRVWMDNMAGPSRMTVGAMTAEDDRVAMEIEVMATLKNGKTYNQHYHFLFVVRAGQICGIKEYCDTLHAFETLGGEMITGPRVPRESNIW